MKITKILGFVFTVVGLTTLAIMPTIAQKIDLSASTVKWTGYHLAKSYEHTGFVKVKSGEVSFKEGSLASGKIIIDMNSISNSDLTDAKDNKKLVKDLKSERFFNVKEHPEASILLTKVVAKSNSKYLVQAEIEIRGIKEDIEFTLVLSSSNGNTILTGKLAVDRTKHEVMYGWSIGNAVLSNTFDMEVKIVVASAELNNAG